jgi:ribosomal protein S18 acetylase RimI-like enzyme
VPGEIAVRRFELADRTAVLGLAGRLTIGVAPWRDGRRVAGAVRTWVAASIGAADEEGRAVFVAVVGDQVVGVATVAERAHWTGELDANIDELVTAEGHEGRGVARALMGAVEAWAAGRGLANVTLETGAKNARARDFYRRAGYEEEELRYTKRLSG